MSAKHKSLSAIATDRIRRMIVDGRLELGERIKDAELAEEMGLSKTPVREALLQLTTEHLITVQPRKGFFVFSTDREDLDDMCSLRISLEQTAMRYAMRRNPLRLIAALENFVEQSELLLQQEKYDLNKYLKLDYDFHHTISDFAQNLYLSDALSTITTKIQCIRYRTYYDPRFVKRSFDDHNKMHTMLKEEDLEGACAFMDVHVRRIFEPDRLLRINI